MKLAINTEYGGFTLSDKGKKLFLKYGGTLDMIYTDSIEFRSNPILHKVISELGLEASRFCSVFKIIEIPDNIEVYIDDYDGIETVHEKHRFWD